MSAAVPASIQAPEVPDLRWHAVLARDAKLDGVFYYAVQTTGIFCKPSCPSRKPTRSAVEFFDCPDKAESAGYRPCRRCLPRTCTRNPHAAIVKTVCDYIEQNLESSLSLSELAASVNESPTYLQKVFKRVTGISPREYADSRRYCVFKTALRFGHQVTDAIYHAGYGSSSRLYERTAQRLGMTPSAYRAGAPAVQLRYTLLDCPLGGKILLAATERGVCNVKMGADAEQLIAELHHEYPKAEFERDDAGLRDWAKEILGRIGGKLPSHELPLDIRETAFQRRVYNELRRIPVGQSRTYAEVAKAIGAPKAHRAVARACATNRIAVLVPCHRVVRSDGGLGGYRWGLDKKEQLLENERGAKVRRPGAGR